MLPKLVLAAATALALSGGPASAALAASPSITSSSPATNQAAPASTASGAASTEAAPASTASGAASTEAARAAAASSAATAEAAPAASADSIDTAQYSADSVAVGAVLTGAANDISTLRFGIRDAGPAASTPRTVRLLLPPGVDVTVADGNCSPIAERVFTCKLPAELAAGTQRIFTFSVQLGETAGASGTVVVDGGPLDKNTANDKASIEVKLTAGAQAAALPTTDLPTGTLSVVGIGVLLIGVGSYLTLRRPLHHPA